MALVDQIDATARGIMVQSEPDEVIVQEKIFYHFAFGIDHKIKLTKVGNETTVEIVSQKDYQS